MAIAMEQAETGLVNECCTFNQLDATRTGRDRQLFYCFLWACTNMGNRDPGRREAGVPNMPVLHVVGWGEDGGLQPVQKKAGFCKHLGPVRSSKLPGYQSNLPWSDAKVNRPVFLYFLVHSSESREV